MEGSRVSVSAEGERSQKAEFREFEGREGSESETEASVYGRWHSHSSAVPKITFCER